MTKISAFDIELPADVEEEILTFMKSGIGMSRLFTARVLREGLTDEMIRRGHDASCLPENWSRRIIDALLKREREAERISIVRRGPDTLWCCVHKKNE